MTFFLLNLLGWERAILCSFFEPSTETILFLGKKWNKDKVSKYKRKEGEIKVKC
jgi:hypothetical protein